MRQVAPGVKAARISGVLKYDGRGQLTLVPDGHVPGGEHEGLLSEEELRAAEQRKRKLRAEEPVYFGAPDPQALATALSWRNIDARVLNAPVPGYDDDVLAVVEVLGGGGVQLAKNGARIELRAGRTTIVCSEEEAALMLKEVVIDQLVVL